MNELIKDYINKNYDELIELIKCLAVIPAPSGKEEKRAEFCLQWLKDAGTENAYIDEAKNVVFPLNCEHDEITVFSAHADIVFPDTETLPLTEDSEKIYCPGVGDDTASVCVFMLAIRFIIEYKISFKTGALFVLNSCEEGLGNLK